MSRNDRCAKVADALGRLQLRAKEYTEMPNEPYRCQRLSEAAERYVAAIEAIKNDK